MIQKENKFRTPIFVNLDRLDITDSFYIDNFSTSFVSDGIKGNFNGLFMGIDPVTGKFNSKLENSSTEILSIMQNFLTSCWNYKEGC